MSAIIKRQGQGYYVVGILGKTIIFCLCYKKHGPTSYDAGPCFSTSKSQPRTPRCSSKIFVPIKQRITPPARVALFLNLPPNFWPTQTPVSDKRNVVQPINEAAGKIFTCKKAKVIPTAMASILVATERTSNSLQLNRSWKSSAS